jgi:hypothetical protein
VVSDVDQGGHFRHTLPQKSFDALTDGHFGEATALTAAFEADSHTSVSGIDNDHAPTVYRNSGIHFFVDDPRDPRHHTAVRQSRSCLPRPNDVHHTDLR